MAGESARSVNLYPSCFGARSGWIGVVASRQAGVTIPMAFKTPCAGIE